MHDAPTVDELARVLWVELDSPGKDNRKELWKERSRHYTAMAQRILSRLEARTKRRAAEVDEESPAEQEHSVEQEPTD